MEKYELYVVSVFIRDGKGGNLAGIVINGEDFSEKQMKSIANELNFSETAFIMYSDCADYKIRFFTPNSEVDICGHATIGAFSLLRKLEIIDSKIYYLETKAGIFEIIVEKGNVFMEQKKAEFFKVIDIDEVLVSLNITHKELDEDIPIKIISTGLRDIFIPIKNKNILNKISPDFEEVKNISKKNEVVGYHLFAVSKEDNIDVYCRNLAPLYGISEESATGTSNCALACYLYELGIRKKDEDVFTIIQGESLGAISEITVKLKILNNEIKKCYVGGQSLVVEKKFFH